MTPTLITLLVIGSILVILIVWGIMIYNRLIELKNRFMNGFFQIDVQLQRRYDLIPNLVETAKGYMKYEQETLEKVIQARNQAQSIEARVAQKPDDANAMKQLIQAETGLTSMLRNLFALAENYPDLKANQTMQQLMEELSTTENRIAFARQAYNDSVMQFNTYRTQFPNVIISGISGFSENAIYFEVESPDAKKAVQVSFT